MQITFDELKTRHEWIHKELFSSLTSQVINDAKKDQFFEVKLIVNGAEFHPFYYNQLVNNLEKHIEEEAKKMVVEKMKEAEQNAQKLINILSRAKSQIFEEYGISDDDF